MFGLPIAFDNFTFVFIELAIGLLLVVILGGLARFLRQPLILAYILTGALISILGLVRLGGKETLPLFASFGVAFLLFLVGIELKISDLRQVGRTALYTGFGQLLLTFFISFLLVRLLDFTAIQAIYIALALTFSSTIIVVKLLTEKKDLNSLYGQITIGLLLIQDFAAILALIILSGFEPGGVGLSGFFALFAILVKGGVLFLAAVFLNKFILPQLFRYTAASAELLFITAVSWCFIFASFAKIIGFSFEIGAFLAGVALASSPFHLQISAKIRPLRDFFVVIFFIVLGTGISFANLGAILWPTLILSLFVVVAKPLIVLAVMGFLGQRKRTSFLTSITIAQISEFSLILTAAGARLGHLSSEVVSMVALIGVITITVSSYLIIYSNRLYARLSRLLDVFEMKGAREGLPVIDQKLEDHIILVGCEQMGRDLLAFFERKELPRSQLVIVDFNPKVINTLQAEGFNSVYGDISDIELLEELNLSKAKLLISTITDLDDNVPLISFCKSKGLTGPIIVTTYWARDAIKLYEAGADYVVVPELVGGDHTARVLADHWDDLAELRGSKERNLTKIIEISRAVDKAS